jgi:ribose 5-phosphate isomerase B
MVIYFGADHRGFALKQKLIPALKEKGYEVVDMGAAEVIEGDDYVDYAKLVAERVSADPESRGVLICGSGAGMSIAANKLRRVRASLGMSNDEVFDARHDDDLNVLCLASEFVSEEDAKSMVNVFLSTPFSAEERYVRRLNKISELEK